LWFDEGISIKIAKLPVLSLLKFLYSDVHPPLYFYLLHYWIKLFGSSEAAVRFLSLFFGELLILYIYLFCRKFLSLRTAVIASVLISISAFLIRYSQETRSYSLLAFLTAASMYYFLSTLTDYKKQYSILHIITSTLLIYTHVYGFFIITAQIVFLLIYYKTAGKEIISIAIRNIVLTFVFFLPWAWVLLNQISTVSNGFWIERPGLSDLADTLKTFNGPVKNDLSLFLSIIIFAAIGLTAIYYAVKRRILLKDICKEKKYILLILWLLFPVLIPYIISVVRTPIFYPKYCISAYLALIILFSHSLSKIEIPAIRYPVMLVFIILFAKNIQYLNNDITEEWREATAYLAQNINTETDEVLIYPDDCKTFLFDYYFPKPGAMVKGIKTEFAAYRLASHFALRQAKVVWFLYRYDDYKNFNAYLANLHYRVIEKKQFQFITLYKFIKE
jgi:uncharacterized membrane protein